MFTAFGGALSLDDPSSGLRQQVADYILEHPEKYNHVVLGDDPQRYITRIKQSDTWGGYIELAILSDVYDIEICSIDVKVGPGLVTQRKRHHPAIISANDGTSHYESTNTERGRQLVASSYIQVSTTTELLLPWTSAIP
jgi:hypothetical protein